MEHHKTESPFSHPVSSYGLKVDNYKVEEHLKALPYHSIRPHFDIYGAGFSSNVLDSLPELDKEIKLATQDYIKKVWKYNVNFYIFKSWAQKILPQGQGHKHYHSNSWLSGVYYPLGRPGFKIAFHNPTRNPWYHEPLEYNEYNCTTWTVTAQDNMVILFPSYLEHCPEKNTSLQDRYSVAFNVIPEGTFGSHDSEITLNH